MTKAERRMMTDASNLITAIAERAHNQSGVPGPLSSAHPGLPDTCNYGLCKDARAMVARMNKAIETSKPTARLKRPCVGL